MQVTPSTAYLLTPPDQMFPLKRASLFVASSACLCGFCLGADYVIFKCDSFWRRLPHGQALRAISDSLVHGVVGGWSWANMLLVFQMDWSSARLLQVALCVAMAAGMDLDHMIEAKSLHIEDALNLGHRPFAHNFSLVVLVTATLKAVVSLHPSLQLSSFAQELPAMFAASICSHHLRDADRRGIWLAPFGSSSPIGKLYVLLVALLPLCSVAVIKMDTFVRFLLLSFISKPRTRMILEV